MTDQSTKQTVLDELSWEPSINAAHIGVTARNGVVTMTGHVGSYAEKYAAERAAERVSGVKAIAQELEVRYPSSADNGDDDIAKRALQALAWDVFIPRDKVKIKVTKGVITLTGDLDWQYQKESAESVVRRLGGVTGVFNEIKIKPSIKRLMCGTKSRQRWFAMPRSTPMISQSLRMAARSRLQGKWTASTSAVWLSGPPGRRLA
jgi:osmotically-inducible protein OsmY